MKETENRNVDIDTTEIGLCLAESRFGSDNDGSATVDRDWHESFNNGAALGKPERLGNFGLEFGTTGHNVRTGLPQTFEMSER